MRIEYDPMLVEQAVFLAVRRQREEERAFHDAVDPLYAIADVEERDRRFQQTCSRFFMKLGLGRSTEDLIHEHPLLIENVDRCVVRVADRRAKQGAELRVITDADQRRAVAWNLLIHLAPSAFVEPGPSRPALQRELLQAADMLDPRFSYQPESMAGASQRQKLINDRFRVLWDVYAEGRLSEEASKRDELAERLTAAVARALSVEPGAITRGAVRALLDRRSLSAEQLLGWASAPQRFLDGVGTDATSPDDKRPGVQSGDNEADMKMVADAV